jgi:hypothetical protein
MAGVLITKPIVELAVCDARSISRTLDNITINISGSHALATALLSEDYIARNAASPPSLRNQFDSVELH